MLERRCHDQRHESDNEDDDDDDYDNDDRRRRRSRSAHLGMIFVRRMIGVVQIAMRIFQDLSILGTEGLLLWAGDCQLYLCVCVCVCVYLGQRSCSFEVSENSLLLLPYCDEATKRCEV